LGQLGVLLVQLRLAHRELKGECEKKQHGDEQNQVRWIGDTDKTGRSVE
jgi:hypothetical protein